jgi:F-type H+-transporting ATPase subunit gamma
MENLLSIKNRIITVESIVKATNAMKMVTTVKLSRVNHINKHSRDCSDKLFEVLQRIMGFMIFKQELDEDHWLLPREEGNTLLLVFSTNQGFCGSFNQSIVNEAKKHITPKVITKIFGSKGASLSPDGLVEIPDRFDISSFSEIVCNVIVDCLKRYRLSRIIVVSGYFKNVLVQEVKSIQIFPFIPVGLPKYTQIDESAVDMIDALFLAYISKLFNAIITAHIVSELSARTIAMDNSVRNAKDMHKALSVLYNKTRQSKITQELTEIVASMESVQ